MSVQIENTQAFNYVAPARNVIGGGAESALTKKMRELEVGQGFSYVATARDGKGKPTHKQQYSKIDPAKWSKEGKTFKIMVAGDQDGLNDDQTRFVVGRVEYEEYVPRAPRKSAAPAATADANEGQNTNEGGEDQDGNGNEGGNDNELDA